MGTISLLTAKDLLTRGEIVIFPTETVYGLGGNGYDDHAIQKIYKQKGRPSYNPLIFHFANANAAKKELIFCSKAHILAEVLWPGPLTLILKRRKSSLLSPIACAHLPTAGARVPAHSTARALLQELPFPLAAPSANPSGRLSATNAHFALSQFDGATLPIVDGGPCQAGLESTIIDLTSERPILLRAGTIAKEVIEDLLQEPICSSEANKTIKCPGLLLHHYAPTCPVRLGFSNPKPTEALLAFGEEYKSSDFKAIFQLSKEKNLEEAARNLYVGLYNLSLFDPSFIAVMPIPDRGIGVAINERLRRASIASCHVSK